MLDNASALFSLSYFLIFPQLRTAAENVCSVQGTAYHKLGVSRKLSVVCYIIFKKVKFHPGHPSVI